LSFRRTTYAKRFYILWLSVLQRWENLILTFTDFEEFLKEARSMGVVEDLRQLTSLDVIFFEKHKNYMMLNLRDYDEEEPNNILILSRDKNIVYTRKQIPKNEFRMFSLTMQKPYGESTALALIMFKKGLQSYSARFDKIHSEISALEDHFDLEKISETSNRMRKLIDKVDDFMNVLIGVEERRVREVNTSYAGYDYHVLTATATHLLDRCRNTSNRVKDLRSEYEMKSSQELNKRIEYLTDVMKKLTALTLILMIPNIIASHYGMNFKYMPELLDPLGYPLTILASVLAVVVAIIIFKKKNWL